MDKIQAICSLNTAKVKWGYCWGQTKLKSHLESLETSRSGTLNFRTPTRAAPGDGVELHQALQSQYETLLSAQGNTKEITREKCAGDYHKQQHRMLAQSLKDFTNRVCYYQDALSLQHDLNDLENITDNTTRVFDKAFANFLTRYPTSGKPHPTLLVTIS